jgi:hypothetical protein
MAIRAVPLAFLLAGLVQTQSHVSDVRAQEPNPAAAAPVAPPFVKCPGGGPLGAVHLSVHTGNQSLPFRTINHLSEGDIVRYAAILRGKEERPGEVALILIPQNRQRGEEDIIVTDPKPADKKQEWKMPRTISLAALVYGPAGLNRKKVAKFLAQDEVLIAQLADYADKTAEAEQLVAVLSNNESSSARINSALSGFASQYGFAVQIDRNASIAAQAQTVFAAMNPQLANYNPLASSTAQRAGQTASMASMAASLFFGSPVGLVAGGTAMLLDLRAIAFPDTQFRAAFAQPLGNSDVNLCGPQGPVPSRTRIAYIWVNRIPNIRTPSIRIGDTDHIPITQKTPVLVDASEPGWKYLDRVREWALVDDQQKKIAVPVVKLANQKGLEIDLTKAAVPIGDYKLTGFWDWTPLQATGTVHVLGLSDFGTAHLDPASQDRLLAKSGKAPVTVRGSDFEFTTKVELRRLNDEFATAQGVRFLLPKGLPKGPQYHMDVQIDTNGLDPGPYELLISQQDDKSHPVNFKVLPNPPKISNLPILVNQGVNSGGVNQGAATQHFVLKGERLELFTKLEAPGAVLQLNPPESSQTERSLTVVLQSPPKPGTALPVRAYLQDRSEPLIFPDALEIVGPLPLIASSRLSVPTGMAISVRSDEFPAGYTLNALLDVKNMERQSVVRLMCVEGVGEHTLLHIGEQNTHQSLQQLSPDQLFLAFDTTGLPAGCSLQAMIDNGRGGSSPPFTLAHILRIPRIDSLTVSANPPQNEMRRYQLTGENLEMIAKLGWDDGHAALVSDLPEPLPAPGLKQSIGINLPEPPNTESKLYVWLRGDQQGRLATIPPPALPSVTPPPAAASATDQPAQPKSGNVEPR